MKKQMTAAKAWSLQEQEQDTKDRGIDTDIKVQSILCTNECDQRSKDILVLI